MIRRRDALAKAARRALFATAIVALVAIVATTLPVVGSNNAKDWKFFFGAAWILRNPSAGDLYAPWPESDPHVRPDGYIYPPLLAVAILPLSLLGFWTSAKVWFGLLTAGTLASIAVGSREALRRIGGRSAAHLRDASIAASIAWLLSANVAQREFDHAQSDWITVLAFTLALAWIDRRPTLAGTALGLAANVKYHTLVVLPYLLVRRRWRAAGAVAISSAAFALAPALVVGWDRNLAYLARALGGIAQFGGIEVEGRANVWSISHLDSISCTSALARLSEHLGLGTSGSLAFTGAVALACLGLAWWMFRAHALAFWKGANDPLIAAAEWSGLIVATIAFSPQTLKRHMFLLVPVYVLAAAMLARPRGTRRVLAAGLLVSLLTMYLPPRSAGMTGVSDAWRAIGGTSWGQLVLFFSILWTALAWSRPTPGVTPEARPSHA